MKPYKGGRAGRGKGKKGKKSGGRVVDAFGSDGDAPSKDRRSSRPSKNKPTRQERSALGFVVAAAVAVGGIAVAILSNVKSRKESDRVLRSMRKKPLAITDHAACRYVWQVCQHFSGTSRPRVGSGPVTRSLTHSLTHSNRFYLIHRMDCRFVSKKDVLESLFKGRVNRRKSDLAARPGSCAKVVVDATISKGNGRTKNVQNVFAACEDETRLLTAIDTSTNWPCGPC